MIRERLPTDRHGVTIHFTILVRDEMPDGEGRVREAEGYITMNARTDGRLAEVFVKFGKAGDDSALLDQWAQQVSNRLQEGVSVEQVFRPHVGTQFGASGIVRGVKEVERCTSVCDLIARLCLSRFGQREAA